MKIKELINILELYNPEVSFNIRIDGNTLDVASLKVVAEELEVIIDIKEVNIPF